MWAHTMCFWAVVLVEPNLCKYILIHKLCRNRKSKKNVYSQYMVQARVEPAGTLFSSYAIDCGLFSVERNLIDCLKEYIAGRFKKEFGFLSMAPARVEQAPT
jgi:hypothetical protein